MGSVTGRVKWVTAGVTAGVVLTVGLAVWVSGGAGGTAVTTGTGKAAARAAGPYPECAVILQWFRENDPYPEEVEVIAWQQRRVTPGSPCVVTVKYRGRKGNGAKAVRQKYFSVAGGKVVIASADWEPID